MTGRAGARADEVAAGDTPVEQAVAALRG